MSLPTQKNPATRVIELLPTPVVRAGRSLDNARRALGYTTPCESNPTLWDTRRPGVSDDPATGREIGREPLENYVERARFAALTCQSCVVFPECTALLNTLNPRRPEMSGIIAGVLVDTSQMGVTARTILARRPKRTKKGTPDGCDG